MKKVLVLDRDYSLKYMKSNEFEVIVVTIQKHSKKVHANQNLNVVACFEEAYPTLDVADFDNDYLLHSWDCDRYLSRFSIEKRKEILGKEITFWRNVFDTFKPSCIVNEIVTIEFMEVMYIEALKRGIPYYTWSFVPIAPKDIWVHGDPFNTKMIGGYWDKILPTPANYDEAKMYIQNTREKGHKPFYICLKKKTKMMNFLNSFKKVIKYTKVYLVNKIKGGFVYEENFHLACDELRMAFNSLFYNYDKLETSDNVEYFFYPLHLEPEAAVEYSGYYFNDQVMLIGRIAHSLKLNQKLIVKEHPQQLGALTTSRFRRLKEKYPNLIFLRGDISSYKIYPLIKGLITLNGTAGFESWICKIPVVVFGDVFYKDFPGVISCDSFKKLHDLIRNDKFSRPKDDDICTYVAKIFNQSQILFPYLEEGKFSQENLISITKQVESFLKTKDDVDK